MILNYVVATPFTLRTNVTNDLFHARIVLERHETVAILENKENNFCGLLAVNIVLKVSYELELNDHALKK